MQSTRNMEERVDSASAIHHDSASPAESQKKKSTESWTPNIVREWTCYMLPLEVLFSI